MPVNHVFRTEIEIKGKTTPLVARVNRRAKRLILSVDPVLGEIRVTAPSKRSLPEAVSFARERSDWIAGQMTTELAAKPFVEGGAMPYNGVNYEIVRRGGPRARIEIGTIDDNPVIFVGGESAHINRRITDWLKKRARVELTERVDHFCEKLQQSRGAIRIRDTRTRWGSCSSDRVLSFSWRLVMAPPTIIDYVAAHECAHLVHMNHSPAFWRLIASMGVDARGATNWFKENGAVLFSYGAEAA